MLRLYKIVTSPAKPCRKLEHQASVSTLCQRLGGPPLTLTPTLFPLSIVLADTGLVLAREDSPSLSPWPLLNTDLFRVGVCVACTILLQLIATAAEVAAGWHDKDPAPAVGESDRPLLYRGLNCGRLLKMLGLPDTLLRAFRDWGGPGFGTDGELTMTERGLLE